MHHDGLTSVKQPAGACSIQKTGDWSEHAAIELTNDSDMHDCFGQLIRLNIIVLYMYVIYISKYMQFVYQRNQRAQIYF